MKDITKYKMYYSRFLIIVLLIVLGIFLCTNNVTAQKENNISIHSENNQIIDATKNPSIQYLNGDVQIYHSGAFMYCDTAILSGSALTMRHNVVMIQNDTIRIFCDSMTYNSDSLVAYFYGNIILENGPSKKLYTTLLRYEVNNKIAYYTKNARLVEGTSTLISRIGKYMINEKTAYFYNNVKINGEDFDLVTDSLSLNTETQIATFLGPVRIDSDTSKIYSQKGWFDLDDKIGDFIGNAQYLEDSIRAKADTIAYDSKKGWVTLSSDTLMSEYISVKDTAYAKTIFYDKENEVFRLTKNGWYKGEKNEVKGDYIFYDKKTEKFNVKGRSFVSDPPSLIEADTLDYDKTIKYGKADGHVIWRDTSAKTSIYADHVLYLGEENFMKASNDSGRPLFMTDIDSDTLYMRADTLRAFRKIQERIILPDRNAARKAKIEKDKSQKDLDTDTSKYGQKPSPEGRELKVQTKDSSLTHIDTLSSSASNDTIFTGIMDTIDYFVGDNDVRIYKSDMQAVCDSLVYNKKDSIFTLHTLPFVWSDSSQIAGDTIDIIMKNKKIDKLTVTSSATIINSEDLLFFNQIRGRYVEAFFEDSKIYRMDVDGDAQIVYYLTDDDKAYIGVNTTEASNMSFLFTDNKISDIRNYREPKSKVLPMRKTDHDALKVKGFIWNIEKRPLDEKGL